MRAKRPASCLAGNPAGDVCASLVQAKYEWAEGCSASIAPLHAIVWVTRYALLVDSSRAPVARGM
eukprot:14488130-Alexandrium_andersonii.AAC.1